MTDKVDSAIYIHDVEFDKIKTIKLKTFLTRVNHTLRNENQIYFALKNDAIKSRKENQSWVILSGVMDQVATNLIRKIEYEVSRVARS